MSCIEKKCFDFEGSIADLLEILSWISTNTTSYSVNIYGWWGTGYFKAGMDSCGFVVRFDSESDAVALKLRWIDGQ